MYIEELTTDIVISSVDTLYFYVYRPIMETLFV